MYAANRILYDVYKKMEMLYSINAHCVYMKSMCGRL